MAATDWRSLFSEFHRVWDLQSNSPGITPALWRQLLCGAASSARPKPSLETEAISLGLYPEFARNWPLFETAKKAREDAFQDTGADSGARRSRFRN